jgi:hypothetical protein
MRPRHAILLASVAAPTLALAAHAVIGEADEPRATTLSQPWRLGDEPSVSVALDGGGASSVGWSGDRPIGLESRHEIADGVSLHFGAEALSRAEGSDLLEQVPDWQAGAALRTRLDGRWTAGIGAGWRSTASGSSLSSVLDTDQRAGALDDGEGVVWFRLSASF